MERKIVYRRFLLCLLTISIVFAVYFFDSHRVLQDTATSSDNYISENARERSSLASTEGKIKVYPCGFQIGIYLQTNGVMVIGTDEVEGEDGLNYNPAFNKIKAGDYITKVNDIDVSSKSQLLFLVNKYGNEDLVFTLYRNEKEIKVKITPIKTGEEEYKVGIWVRDDTQGIGTMTYLTEEGNYAALGHGISDVDTGELLDSEGGILYQANVWGIKKGEIGNPGALYGMISYEENKILGEISKNTAFGIFGKLSDDMKKNNMINQYQLESVELAGHEKIKKGKAYIRSNVSGDICDYEVEIEKINENSSKNKGIVLKVTDDKLLELTNGIVQGMSGSPILQDGKLVGAVTHVFVNDPTRGYGIFIENMLEQ